MSRTSGNFRFTEAEELEIVRLYQEGMSARAIGRLHNMDDQRTIVSVLKRQGIEQRPASERCMRYALDPTMFDVLTPEATYWYGFIYADGYLHRQESLVVGLARRDHGHLEKLRDFLKSGHPIRDYTVSSGKKRCEASDFRPSNQHLLKRLIELGLGTPRQFDKVLTNVPEEYIHHWIRGYFDGNGHTRNSTKLQEVGFCGTLNVIEWIRLQLASHAYRRPDQKLTLRKGTNIYYVVYGGRFQVIDIYDYLYRDATVWLDRKREIIDILMKPPKNTKCINKSILAKRAARI